LKRVPQVREKALAGSRGRERHQCWQGGGDKTPHRKVRGQGEEGKRASMPIRAQVKKPGEMGKFTCVVGWVKGDRSVPDHCYSVGVRSSQHPGTLSLVSEAGVRILSEEEGEASGGSVAKSV